MALQHGALLTSSSYSLLETAFDVDRHHVSSSRLCLVGSAIIRYRGTEAGWAANPTVIGDLRVHHFSGFGYQGPARVRANQ